MFLEVVGAENPTYAWYKDGCYLGDRNMNTPVLIAQKPSIEDDGKFECRVTDTDFGVQVKRTFYLVTPSKAELHKKVIYDWDFN